MSMFVLAVKNHLPLFDMKAAMHMMGCLHCGTESSVYIWGTTGLGSVT